MSRSVHQSSELKSSVPLKLTTMRFGFVSDALNTKACVRFFSWNADHKKKTYQSFLQMLIGSSD